MKLYDFKMAPNPRRVRMFLAEKGISDLEVVNVDIGKGETFKKEFREINPYGGLPVLELDSGERISESMAICRYFEETHPGNPLMGTDPESKARIEMWNRRLELHLYNAIAGCFQNSNPMWAPVVEQVAEYADACLNKADKHFHKLDKRLAESTYVAGEEFSVADITAVCCVDFAKVVQRRLDEEKHPNIARWYKLVNERPSAQA